MQAARQNLSAEELLEIHREVREQALADPASRYEDPAGQGPSVSRVQAIVGANPALGVVERAAWILRAIVLVQPFPDGNHRTGLLAAELLLGRDGIRFRPSPDAAAEFQRKVSSERFARLRGYDDAPLSVLVEWNDQVMACCLDFIHKTVDEIG